MTITCPTCQSMLDDNTAGAIAVKLLTHIESSWSGWDADWEKGQHYRAGDIDAEIVSVKDSWVDELDSDTSAYAHQGETFEAHIIFKVGEYFFKKAGTGDSYGEVSWNGPFRAVAAKAKTITVYEWE